LLLEQLVNLTCSVCTWNHMFNF